MTYSQQLLLARCLSVVAGVIVLIQAGNADVLGLSVRALAWLGILSGAVSLALAALPSVRGSSRDPSNIAERIGELTPAKRRELLADVERRHALEGA